MKRNPKLNPLPGDLLTFQKWRIAVTQRDGSTVFYSATHPDGRTKREASQPVEQWGKWAAKSKVLERAEDEGCCTISNCAAGPCVGCKQFVGKDAHITGEGVFHGECCSCRGDAKRSGGGSAPVAKLQEALAV